MIVNFKYLFESLKKKKVFYKKETSRELHEINNLHEGSLRIIYDDCNSKFEDFLTADSSFIIHHQNI